MSSIWGHAAAIGAGGYADAGASLTSRPGAMAAPRSGSHTPGGSMAASQQGKAAYANAAAPEDDSSSTSDANTSISANDFLTLLVTEMQNQDPTSDMDPNEYIDQLTEINSLEQLISINQNLQTALGETTTSSESSTGGATKEAAKSAVRHPASVSGASNQTTTAQESRLASKGGRAEAIASGNLSSPKGSEAAARVGRALSGQSRTAAGPAIRDIPTRALP